MIDASGKLLVYFEDEEPLVRRLGAAVISCWDELPATVRLLLVRRAKQVLDEDEPEHIDTRMSSFLAEHRFI